MDLNNNTITFSTCFYKVKSKFDITKYVEWMTNLLSIVNHFNLVIYTNQETLSYFAHKLTKSNQKRIRIIIKPFNEFYTYKYSLFWINNHKHSNLMLHKHIDWQLNMLWNQKPFFVAETIRNKYFDTDLYGWIDIGYFRNRDCDLHTNLLSNWASPDSVEKLDNSLIHYGCVQKNLISYTKMAEEIRTHYKHKMIKPPTTKYEENMFAGGFFILHKLFINLFTKLYNEKLQYYFSNNYLIKDDQTIVQDIIFTNQDLFEIHNENNDDYDNWFMFQRILN